MIPKIFQNPEAQRARAMEAANLAAEKRQVGYTDQQQIMSAATNPQENQMYNMEQESRADFLKWQQDLDDEQMDLIRTLLGFAKDGGEWIKIEDQQMCNKTFIHEVIIPQFKPFLSRNMINSNFKEDQILDNLRNTSNDIADAMADNHDKYSIDFKNYDLVVRMIKNTMKSSAFRSLDGWTKKIDSTMIRRIEAMHDTNQETPKKKFMGLF